MKRKRGLREFGVAGMLKVLVLPQLLFILRVLPVKTLPKDLAFPLIARLIHYFHVTLGNYSNPLAHIQILINNPTLRIRANRGTELG